MTRRAKTIMTFETNSGCNAARAMLECAVTALAPRGLSATLLARVELVLAEVLNNVVEHGYRASPGHPLALSMQQQAGGLVCLVTDHGAPYPEGCPPPGRPLALDCPRQDLPEGGWGWGLIRQLTDKLEYERCGGQNRLTLHFRVM